MSLTNDQPSDAEITLWGRRIHGPTLPGQGIRCKRETPLSAEEIAELSVVFGDDGEVPVKRLH